MPEEQLFVHNGSQLRRRRRRGMIVPVAPLLNHVSVVARDLTASLSVPEVKQLAYVRTQGGEAAPSTLWPADGMATARARG